MEKGCCSPYFDPEFDSSPEPPRVCIDNDTCKDCTVVKVDSANRHGILLEMVQVLTDLDLVISKSYISSDGGWLMDVFHVTDQLGSKLRDKDLIRYIQESLQAAERPPAPPPPAHEVNTCLGHLASDYTALEMTAVDRPGVLSEVTAVLAVLSCDVDSGAVWTHNGRAACVLYVTDRATGRPISDPGRLAGVEERVGSVLEAHHAPGELRRVRLTRPPARRVHTERRLHQMMQEDGDYEAEPAPPPVEADDQFGNAIAAMDQGRWWLGGSNRALCGLASPTPPPPPPKDGPETTQVSIDRLKEMDYSVVTVRSRDRPKLLFDTVCALTDLQYDVFHASVSCHGSVAVQEYYVRRRQTEDSDQVAERGRVIRSLVSAVERRASHGLKVEVRTADRQRLLPDATRAFRENGLSLARAYCGRRGDRAVGTFYVIGAAASGSAEVVDPAGRMESLRHEIGGGVFFGATDDSDGNHPVGSLPSPRGFNSSNGSQPPAGISLGSILRSSIQRFSSNFGSIRS